MPLCLFSFSLSLLLIIPYCISWQGHQGCVNAIAWNSKGSLLISGSDDTRVYFSELICQKKYFMLTDLKALSQYVGFDVCLYAAVF